MMYTEGVSRELRELQRRRGPRQRTRQIIS